MTDALEDVRRQCQHWKPPDHRKVTQTAVVWTCLPFIRSGQNHLARQNERGKKARQTEKKVGKQHQGMDRPGVRQVPEGSGGQRKMEETGCEIICGAPTTLAVEGQMRRRRRRQRGIVYQCCHGSRGKLPLLFPPLPTV